MNQNVGLKFNSTGDPDLITTSTSVNSSPTACASIADGVYLYYSGTRQKVPGRVKKRTIDIGHIPNGLYFLHIYDSKKRLLKAEKLLILR